MNHRESLSKKNYKALLCCLLAVMSGVLSVIASPNGQGTVPFSVENSAVNNLIIKAYEEDPTLWEAGQLYLVGLCYVCEKKLDKAQKIFDELVTIAPQNARAWRALGQVHHMKSANEEAQRCYQRAWSEGQDVPALTLLAGLKIQGKDVEGIKPLLDALMAHQREDVDIQKVLLSYSIMVAEKQEGGPVYASVARSMTKDMVEANDDLRELLLMATLRYKNDEEMPSGDESAASPVSPASSREDREQH